MTQVYTNVRKCRRPLGPEKREKGTPLGAPGGTTQPMKEQTKPALGALIFPSHFPRIQRVVKEFVSSKLSKVSS